MYAEGTLEKATYTFVERILMATYDFEVSR